MDTWNARLAKALAESDYNANSLATALKASAPSVAAWIGAGTITPAKDIKAENLLKACDLLGVRPEWVMFGRLPMRKEANTWPFEGSSRDQFDRLPAREQARISRFIRDTIDDWNSEQTGELKTG